MAATGSRNYPNRIIAESKQCAPTRLLNPFLIFPSAPELAGLGPSVPYIHAPSEELLWGRALAISSSAGWMRRGVRDAEVRGRRQGGRHGGPGFGWVPDLLLFFFFFLMSHPRVSPRWVGAAGSTYGPLRKGQVWVGPAGKAASSCACPLFPSWALGWGRPKGPARGWPFELGSGGRSEQSS